MILPNNLILPQAPPDVLPSNQTKVNLALLLALIASVVIHWWLLDTIARLIFLPTTPQTSNQPSSQLTVAITLNRLNQAQPIERVKFPDRSMQHNESTIDSPDKATNTAIQPLVGPSVTAPQDITPAVKQATRITDRQIELTEQPIPDWRHYPAPTTGGTVFNPKLRQQIERSRTSRTTAKYEQPSLFTASSGREVFVTGDTCFNITAAQGDHDVEKWSIGTRCNWVKAESEQFIDSVNSAMKERFLSD